MRIIYIGKGQQPNLDKMVSVHNSSWKNAACFNNLVNSFKSVVNSHTVANIVAMVTTEAITMAITLSVNVEIIINFKAVITL